MYGIKSKANDVEDIRWIDGNETIARLTAALAIRMTINHLLEFEDGFDIVEETDNKYVARGRRTGFEFSVEVVKV